VLFVVQFSAHFCSPWRTGVMCWTPICSCCQSTFRSVADDTRVRAIDTIQLHVSTESESRNVPRAGAEKSSMLPAVGRGSGGVHTHTRAPVRSNHTALTIAASACPQRPRTQLYLARLRFLTILRCINPRSLLLLLLLFIFTPQVVKIPGG